MQLHSAEENSALRIPNSSLNPKLPDFLRQPLYAVLVLSRQVVYFMHCAVNLLNACRHLVHAVFDNGGELAERRKTRSRKAREERIVSDKTPLNERELAMQREIQELKKARFNCVNQILLPQLNVKFPNRKRAY